jgi:hypothetical protein
VAKVLPASEPATDTLRLLIDANTNEPYPWGELYNGTQTGSEGGNRYPTAEELRACIDRCPGCRYIAISPAGEMRGFKLMHEASAWGANGGFIDSAYGLPMKPCDGPHYYSLPSPKWGKFYPS